MAGKALLTHESIDAQAAFELPERRMMAVAIGGGGLVGVGVAIDNVSVNVPINIEDNEVCVNVAAVAAVAACDQ
jgi:hypothetical protein